MTQVGGIFSDRYNQVMAAKGSAVDILALRTYFVSQAGVLDNEVRNLDKQIQTLTGEDVLVCIATLGVNRYNIKKQPLFDKAWELKSLYANCEISIHIIDSLFLSGNPKTDTDKVQDYKKRINEYKKIEASLYKEILEIKTGNRLVPSKVVYTGKGGPPEYRNPISPYERVSGPVVERALSSEELSAVEDKVASKLYEARKRLNLEEPLWIIEKETMAETYKFLQKCKSKKPVLCAKLETFYLYIERLWGEKTADQDIKTS